MTTTTSNNKPALHPMLLIAALAVVLFCGVGIAAIMGWLPTSNANGALPGTVTSESTTTTQLAPAAPVQMASVATPQSQQALAPYNEPAQSAQSTAPEPVAAAPVCKSCGVVDSVRSIEHKAQGSGVGAAGGAILGGLLGNQVGGGHGRQLATVAGAVGGAVAGNQVETHMKTTYTWRVLVHMDNGTKRTFNLSSQPAWRSGDQVRVVNGQLRAAD